MTPTTSKTMQAIVQDGYGSADVLRLEEIDRPEVAENEVLLQVRAAGLDRGTWHFMTGRPYLMRLGFGAQGHVDDHHSPAAARWDSRVHLTNGRSGVFG